MLRLEWVFLNFLLFCLHCLLSDFAYISSFFLCYTGCFLVLFQFCMCLLIVLVVRYLSLFCENMWLAEQKIFGTVVSWYFSCCSVQPFWILLFPKQHWNIKPIVFCHLNTKNTVLLSPWDGVIQSCHHKNGHILMDFMLYSCLNVLIDWKIKYSLSLMCVFTSFHYVCLGFYAFLAGRVATRRFTTNFTISEHLWKYSHNSSVMYRKHKSNQ